jgi:hypothetical protein
MVICFDLHHHPLGEPRYGLNGTPTGAIHRFMFLTEPVFPTSMWVNGVTPESRAFLHNRLVQCAHPCIPVRFGEPHPWNRFTIIPDILSSTLRASYRCLNRSRRFNPRLRCVPYRDVLMSRAQDAQERPLLDIHGRTSVVRGRKPGTTYTPVDAPFNPSNCGF